MFNTQIQFLWNYLSKSGQKMVKTFFEDQEPELELDTKELAYSSNNHRNQK